MRRKVGKVFWLVGMSGAGKSTIAMSLYELLLGRQEAVIVLDGDEMRRGLCSDLGFGNDDRLENIRRIAHVGALLANAEMVVIIATISPTQEMRDLARTIIPEMTEVFVDAPLEVCEARDPKGLYRRARAGVLQNFTGISAPFDPPSHPDIICRTHKETSSESVSRILEFMEQRLYVVQSYEHA